MSNDTPTPFVGQAHVYGDNINTDQIIPGKYTKTLDLDFLAEHALEDLDPDFTKKMKPGDLIIGGENFGCGSSREQAPLALKAAGVSAVIATFFARIFYRNAVNIGLPVIEVVDLKVDTGDQVEVDLANGKIRNLTNKTEYQATRLPRVMMDILEQGGLVHYLKKHGAYHL